MDRVLKSLDRLFQAIACLIVVALLVTVALGIVTRAWNDPLAWTDELARMLMVWLAMTGWVLSSRRRGHVRIRFFQNLLPDPLRRLLELTIQAGLVLLGAFAAWFGVDLVARNVDLDATSLPVSIAWIYVPLVPAGLITMLQAGVDIALLRHPTPATTEGPRTTAGAL